MLIATHQKVYLSKMCLANSARNPVAAFIVVLVCLAFETSPTLAQGATTITSTTGAGGLGTMVTTHSHTVTITGGFRPGDGLNLFHSFNQFNVGDGDTAQFLNTTPQLATSTILSRVTGGNPSSIFGTIDTTSYPGANLFLMNPAGIISGPNTTLNVSGSVAFTTADYLRLAGATGSNTGIFHANPSTTSVLTNAPVSAFGFLGSNPAAIAVQGSTFTVEPGRSIYLIGGNQGFDHAKVSVPDGVTVTKGLLLMSGGQLNIASVASPGEIMAGSLNQTSNISGQSFGALGAVRISQSTIENGGERGGTIRIRGGHLTIDNATVGANTADIDFDATTLQITTTQLGTRTATTANAGHITLATAGEINIDSSLVGSESTTSSGNAGSILFSSGEGTVRFTNSTVTSQANNSSTGSSGNIKIDALHGNILLTRSNVFNRAHVNGTLKDIQITAYDLHLRDGSAIGGDNKGAQIPGSTTITLDGHLILSEGSFINTGAFGSANSADLIIRSPTISITGKNSDGTNSGLYTSTVSSGDGGRLHLFTDNLQLIDGGILSSKSFVGSKGEIPSGHGGVVNVEGYRNPGTLITINGPGSGISTSTEGTGTAGDIVMKGTSVTLQNEGKISAETTGISSKATGGSITVTATDQLTLSNKTSITASTSGPGNAGNVWVGANDISISGGSTITASSTGSGNAGTVTVQGLQSPVSSFLIDGSNSGVFTKTTNAGTGGNLSVSSNSIVIQNKGTVSGETSGTGSGGNIALTAGQSVTIKDGAAVSSSSIGPGVAGNIEINAGKQLDVERGSITTQSNQLNGGNINIQAIDLVRVVDGKVSTSVLGGAGSGGNITIDPKVVLLQNSDILAQANRGTGGDISITTPVFIADQSSRVDASTPFGLNGRITIQSPTSNLSGTVGQLVSKTSPPQVLLQNRCVALAGGEQSTFILTGRDALPGEPIGWLSSPVSMEHWTGEETAHASQLMVRNRTFNSSPVIAAHSDKSRVLSLRRLTPPGFLVRAFATGATGCPS